MCVGVVLVSTRSSRVSADLVALSPQFRDFLLPDVLPGSYIWGEIILYECVLSLPCFSRRARSKLTPTLSLAGSSAPSAESAGPTEGPAPFVFQLRSARRFGDLGDEDRRRGRRTRSPRTVRLGLCACAALALCPACTPLLQLFASFAVPLLDLLITRAAHACGLAGSTRTPSRSGSASSCRRWPSRGSAGLGSTSSCACTFSCPTPE